MKIVLVISSLGFGGAETQVMALARELVRRKHAVVVYTLNTNNPRASELSGSGVEIVSDQKRLSVDPTVIWRLRHFLLTFNADIVHGFLFDGNFYSRIAVLGTGMPALSSERNDSYQLNRNQRIGHFLTRKYAAGVVANSHAGARFSQKLYKCSVDKVHAAWNGINIDKVSGRVKAYSSDVKQLFFGQSNVQVACLVGSIKPAKDYIYALRVADMLTTQNPKWRVLFVGEKSSGGERYHSEIMCEWEKIEKRNNVKFTGIRDDAVEIVSQCDALFSTSLHEGFPNVVLEAMTVGVPVVSTEYSDIKKILPNSWQIVEARDPTLFVQMILRASKERVAVAEAQRKWVEQNATIAISAKRMEGIYRSYISTS